MLMGHMLSTGAVLTIDGNVILAKSSKQKVNTRSSTETELIAIDDTLPLIQWTQMFLQCQGMETETIIKEDNKSTILMQNTKKSTGKRTRHLDIRYFYIKNLIDRNVIKVEYCSTQDMIGDYFTKPLQGSRFKIFKD